MTPPNLAPSPAGDPPAIRCEGLHKRFPDIHAVRGVDLVVEAGTCLALLGPNGAGKTTTVEMIEGLTPPSEGRVAIFGRRLGQSRAEDRLIREDVGVCLQETHFQERLRVRETIELFRAFHANSAPLAELIDAVSLGPKAESFVGKLSGGQRQRLALACALAGRPRLLCLDEPTTGLDPQSRRQVWDVVSAFRKGGGTVLLTTHYMEEAHMLADRVAIMDGGRIIADGTPAALIAGLGAKDVATLVFDRAPDPAPFAAAVHAAEARVTPEEDGFALTLATSELAARMPALTALAAAQGLTLVRLSMHAATLEDVFIHHTGRGLRDA
jgi:ABC-2 type transport system ATP-binding protein